MRGGGKKRGEGLPAGKAERQPDRLLWTPLDPRWPITEWQLLFSLVTTTQPRRAREAKNMARKGFYSVFTRQGRRR